MTQTPTDALRLVPNMPTVELTDDMLFKIETGETVTWGELKRRQYEQAVRNFNTMREDGSLPAPASPLPGGGWRTDFENAPKDGSVFMVGYDDEAAKKAGLFENKDRVYEARWNDIQSTWSARNGFILHSDATHWQPLPAAPTGEPK